MMNPRTTRKNQKSLDDYARKRWAGMFRDYYSKRWNLFCQALDKALSENKPFDTRVAGKEILVFETEWAKENKTFPTKPNGEDVIEVAKELLTKYAKEFE